MFGNVGRWSSYFLKTSRVAKVAPESSNNGYKEIKSTGKFLKHRVAKVAPNRGNFGQAQSFKKRSEAVFADVCNVQNIFKSLESMNLVKKLF